MGPLKEKQCMGKDEFPPVHIRKASVKHLFTCCQMDRKIPNNTYSGKCDNSPRFLTCTHFSTFIDGK